MPLQLPGSHSFNAALGMTGPQQWRVDAYNGGNEWVSRRMLKLINYSIWKTRQECMGILLGTEVTMMYGSHGGEL